MPYGSEWHLLRFLGLHRHRFNDLVGRAVGGEVTDWLDHRPTLDGRQYFDGPRLDGELTGLDFLLPDDPARRAWPAFWPQTGNVPNWDTVGRVLVGQANDFLLVEAKAHTGELRSACGAAENGGLPRIRGALNAAKPEFGVPPEADWLQPYYQFCNRLTVLNYLTTHGVGARLLFVYFCGDANPHADCPQDEAEWASAVREMECHIGLAGRTILQERVHKLYLPVM